MCPAGMYLPACLFIHAVWRCRMLGEFVKLNGFGNLGSIGKRLKKIGNILVGNAPVNALSSGPDTQFLQKVVLRGNQTGKCPKRM